MSEPTRTEQVTVDGGTFALHVWLPPQGSGPGVLLLQEIFGVGAYIRSVAARLARDGYVVAAPDVFWRISPGWAADHDQAGMEASFGVVSQLDVPLAVEDCAAALAHLRTLPEVRGGVGVLGFCLGGTLGHLLAARAEPDALVSYYGSGVPDAVDRLADISCPALYHFGGNDPFIPRDAVARVVDGVAATGRDDLTVVVQPDAGHAFDNHESAQFHDANAAAAAWAVTSTFLADHLHRA